MVLEGENLPVYDFLYIDWGRVEFWHANLYAGLLTRVETLVETGKSAEKGVGGELGVSIPIPGTTPFSATVGGHAKYGDAGHETKARTEEIDPRLLRPTEVLAEFLERGVKRSLTGTNVDDVVFIEGRLQFFDLDYLKKGLTFLLPSLVQVEQAQSGQQLAHLRSSERKAAQKAQQKASAAQSQLTATTLELLPSGLQIVFTTKEGERCWGQLRRENLWVNPEEVQAKFGRELRGNWNGLFILDSLPDPATEPTPQSSNLEIRDALANIADVMRTAVGRPFDHHAVTPLMIFRKLKV